MNEKETKTLEGKVLISVRRTRIDRILQDDAEEQVIFVRKFETDPARVTVAIGVTRNQGNYESLKLEVRAEVPCYIEEMSAVEKQLSEWVDNRISEKLDELEAAKKAV